MGLCSTRLVRVHFHELVCPFIPTPLQGLHHYYEQICPCSVPLVFALQSYPIGFPLTFTGRFPSFNITPSLHSCCLYTGCHSIGNQVDLRVYPKGNQSLGFDSDYVFRYLVEQFAFAHLHRPYMTDLIPPFP